MTHHDAGDPIRAWFREGPDRGPSRGLEATLARLAQEPRRGRRELRVPVWLPLAAMVALLLAALLAFGAGFRITRPDPFAVATPSPGGACRLEAPVGGIHGVIIGTGFAPDTDVTIDIDRGNGTHVTLDRSYSAAMHTDRRGSFGVQVRPYYDDIGTEVLVARAGCEARLEVRITADDLPPRCPDPTDASEPLVDAARYRAAVVTDRPMAWWHLDDTDHEAVDAVAGNSGVHVGRTVHAARSALTDGGSTFFDFRFPESIAINLSRPVVLDADFTIEFWTYMCEYTDFALPIVGFEDVNVRFDSGDGHLHLSNGIVDVAVADSAMPTDSWHHWALTRRSGDLQLFLDGVTNGWGTSWTDRAAVTMLGHAGEDGNFRGYLDEVALYDHALTADQILAHARP